MADLDEPNRSGGRRHRHCQPAVAGSNPVVAVILAFESSCDETAVALVADGRRVLAERVASQAATFADWGGVVPEIAARGHVAWLPGLVEQVLEEAGIGPEGIDAVAMAAWPGLIGSLLCGLTCAKTLALRWDRPLLAVDHVEAHLAAIHLGREQVTYPLLGLVASGGHSHYYLVRGLGELEALGGTIDDAAGEAWDKVAAMLELGYPGGPIVDRLAIGGDPRRFAFARPLLRDERLVLSFAGIKTSVLYQVRGPKGRDPLDLDEQGVRDVCASFQAAAVDCLAGKLVQAAERHAVRALAVGGGVACNSALRSRLQEICADRHWKLYLPAPRHCQDNAAMVGARAEAAFQAGEFAGPELVPIPTGSAGPRRR